MNITTAIDKAQELANSNHSLYSVVRWHGGIEVASMACLDTWASGAEILEVMAPAI